MSQDTLPTTDESTIDRLDERLTRLEDIILEHFDGGEAPDVDANPGGEADTTLSRRSTLGLLAGGGLIIGTSLFVTRDSWLHNSIQRARADHGPAGHGSVGTADDPLEEVYVENLIETYNVEILEADEIQLSGPFTAHEDRQLALSGSYNLDVSVYDQFNLEQDGILDLSLINDGHALSGQTITVAIHGDGSSVSWPSAFVWRDGEPSDPAVGERLEVNATRRVHPDGTVTWDADYGVWS